MRTTITTALALAAVSALLLPAPAAAHVTVQPSEVPAGGFTRFDVRVPSERDDAATTKVEIEMPDGFIFASYEPVPGWSTQIGDEKLDEPIEAEGGSYDRQVKTITWTADDGDGIQPGQFQDFGLSVGLPEKYAAGDVLTFPAIQTYDNGDVVRWIGSADSEAPAAQVTLTEPVAGHHGADEEASDEAEPADEDDDGAPTWLAVLGVVLGAAGLAVGAVALSKRG